MWGSNTLYILLIIKSRFKISYCYAITYSFVTTTTAFLTTPTTILHTLIPTLPIARYVPCDIQIPMTVPQGWYEFPITSERLSDLSESQSQ